MRVLVTGASGFVGSALIRILAREGCEVLAATRSGQYPHRTGVRPVKMDLAVLDVRCLPDGVDAIVSLAQSRCYRDFPEHAADVLRVNVEANLLLMDWARRAGVRRFVLASTGGVYALQARLALAEGDRLESMQTIDYYLTTKLSAELMLQSYAGFFETAVVLRPFFVYGPGQSEYMLVPRLIGSVRTGRPVQLASGEGPRLNPIYVDDAAQAFANALSLKGWQAMNIAGPDILSVREICDTIGRKLGRSPVYESVAGVPPDLIGNTDLARERLQLTQTRFEAGLGRIIAG